MNKWWLLFGSISQFIIAIAIGGGPHSAPFLSGCFTLAVIGLAVHLKEGKS